MTKYLGKQLKEARVYFPYSLRIQSWQQGHETASHINSEEQIDGCLWSVSTFLLNLSWEHQLLLMMLPRFRKCPPPFQQNVSRKKSSYTHLQKRFHSDSIFNQVGNEHLSSHTLYVYKHTCIYMHM